MVKAHAPECWQLSGLCQVKKMPNEWTGTRQQNVGLPACQGREACCGRHLPCTCSTTRTCCTRFLMAAQLLLRAEAGQGPSSCLLLAAAAPFGPPAITCLWSHHTPGPVSTCQRRGHLEVHLSLLQQLHVPLWVTHPAAQCTQE